MSDRSTFACPLCRSTSSRLFYTKTYYRFRRCRCGTLFQEHPPTTAQLRHLYQQYHASEYGGPREYAASVEPFFAAAARAISGLKPPGALFDIGCAYGDFLALMRERGWNVAGCELAEPAAQYARETRGLDVACGDFFDCEISPASCDAVTAFYVIEHLPDPRRLLRAAFTILKSGGLLYLRIPHTAPLLRFVDIVNPDHDLLHYPFHITDLPPATIGNALRFEGFGDVRISFEGATRGDRWYACIIARMASLAARALHGATGGTCRFPGVSYNVIAVKDGDGKPSSVIS